MARFLDVHPDNPQPRLISQVVDALRDDELIAYPTDSGYALGCRIGNSEGRDRILRDPRPRRPPPLHVDLQGLRAARHVGPRRQRAFRAIKAATPGPYTFILPATPRCRDG